MERVGGTIAGHRWRGDAAGLLVVATAALALAIVGCAVWDVAHGWSLVGDDRGYYGLRAHDVLSRHPPLLGSVAIGQGNDVPISHPGPLEQDLLALPVAVLGIRAGTTVGVAALNALAVVGSAWLLRRRAGPGVALAFVAGLAGLALSMGATVLHDPWPWFVLVLPFALFLVAVALAASGDGVALPIAVGAGSVVLQTHLSSALLVPALVTVAVVGFVTSGKTRRQVGAACGAAAAVGLVCWAFPLYQQLTGRPGNFTALWRSYRLGGQATAGWRDGTQLLAGTVSLPPWWLPPGFADPDPVLRALGPTWRLPVAALSLALVVAGLVWALRDGRRRGDRLVVATSSTALVGLLVGFVTVARTPLGTGLTTYAYLRPLWPLSLWVWCSLGLAAQRRFGLPAWPRLRLRPAVAPRLFLGFALVATALLLPTAGPRSGDEAVWQATAPDATAAVADALDGDDVVLWAPGAALDRAGDVYGPLLLAELTGRGVPVAVDGDFLVRQVGAHRRALVRDASVRLVIGSIGSDLGEPPPGGRLVFRRRGLTTAESAELRELTARIEDVVLRRPTMVEPAVGRWVRDHAPGDPTSGSVATMLAALDELSTRPVDVDGLRTALALLELAGRPAFDDPPPIVAPDRIAPTTLARWRELEQRNRSRSIAIYLVDLR